MRVGETEEDVNITKEAKGVVEVALITPATENKLRCSLGEKLKALQ